MKYLFIIIPLLVFLGNSNAQSKLTKRHVAVCTEGEGCIFSEITIPAIEVDRLLKRINFWVAASQDATLILQNCNPEKCEAQTLEEIHANFGGREENMRFQKIDLEQYLKDKGCFTCLNATKKMSFYIQGVDMSGNGYFFLNIKAGEAYMPDAAFQQLYARQEGANEIVVDQFIRNRRMEQYLIAAGRKYRHAMSVGTDISVIQNDALNERRFLEEFKRTGKTRKHLNTLNVDTEYMGEDDEGNEITFWIAPSYDVCLPPGKFDAFGFYNLGYISIEGSTYLVTEISGPEFQMKLTEISDGSYNFNAGGYQSY